MSPYSLLLLLWPAAVAQLSPEITLPDGTKVVGQLDGSIATFKGIPFAQPPIGKLRWAPPVPWHNNDTSVVIDASNFGSTCAQLLWGHDGPEDGDLFAGSEDCLFLNVFVNLDVALADKALPVGIFVHGGSYITGSSSIPLYDGADAVEFWSGRAIVVTTNYRLNVLGFLGSEALKIQDEEDKSTGNYGIQDQRLAFKWVADNIGAFGGDGKKITIFGESAGAGSMTTHMTAKKSWGTFRGVILESGSFAEWTVTTMEKAQKNYDAFLSSTKCSDVNCILSLSLHDVMKGARGLSGWAPVVDGVELTTHPWIAISNAAVADVPVMHGSNQDEGALFTPLPKILSKSKLEAYWKDYGFTEYEISTLEDTYISGKEYPDNPYRATVNWWAAQRSVGDEIFSCPTKYASGQFWTAQDNALRENPVYMYFFEHLPRNQKVTRHVSELEFVFHQKELLGHEDDMKMADILSSYWGNFIITGNPNQISVGVKSLPNWEPYRRDDDNAIMLLDYDDIHMGSGLKNDECAFFNERIEKSIRASYP